MKGFDAKFIEELKNKNDIVEVVGKIVRLEQRGTNFWGKCPFHHEKTASFCVNSVGQFYHCFGCHRSGDVISFVMETESLDFSDAVKYLAERVKMPLPEIRIDDEKIKKEKFRKERVLALLKDATKYYVSMFRSGRCKAHEEYVRSRGLTKDTLFTFAIGASDGYDGLVSFLKEKGYTYAEMVDSGAVGTNNRNGQDSYYDALAGRLIIPVVDAFGNVVAFCGRIIDGRKNVGKYVNTRETVVFSKGKTLFNLNNLKKARNEEGIDGVIIVEGHMDVISLVQAGIKNVVASMGTALTKDQARIIKRYSDKVFISYDGDFAGQKASIRGLEILKEEGLEVKVVSLPVGLDPDDVVRKFGAAGYLDLLKNAMPLIDFKLDVLKKTYDVKTVDGKRKYILNAVRVIKESPSASEQEDLLKAVRDLTGVTMESLKRDLYNADAPKDEETEDVVRRFEEEEDKTVIAARFVLSAYLFGRPFAKVLDLDKIDFSLITHREIAEYIKEKKTSGDDIKFNDLYEVVSGTGSEELGRIAEVSEREEGRVYEEQYFYDCLRILRLERVNAEIDRLKGVCASETDIEKRRLLMKEINRLVLEKQKI